VWKFLVADVTGPILGADFLSAHRLLVNCSTGQLLREKVPPPSVYVNQIDVDSQSVSDFNDLVRESAQRVSPVPNDVVHEIMTFGRPPFDRARRLCGPKLDAAKAEFDDMLRKGIVRPSCSPYASPLVVVSKPDGTFRPCGDYRRLNSQTIPDRYPLPLMDDVLQKASGCTRFTKLDLRKAFLQIPVSSADIPKTAVITTFGMFEFLRMPFGLRNAAQTMQRHLDWILRDCRDFAAGYVDDIIIASASIIEHRRHVRKVVDAIHGASLELNLKKCVFNQSRLDFLGYTVSADGVKPMVSKVERVTQLPVPTTVKALQRFIGAVNFYRGLIPNLSSLLAPLHRVLNTAPGDRATQSICMQDDELVAFQEVKSALANATAVSFADFNKPFELFTDASNIALAGVLQQRDKNNIPRPIRFFSRKLSPAEVNYSVFDRELLGVVESVKHFQHYLDGRKFTIFTDHKPLVYAVPNMKDPSPRQWRALNYLSRFQFNLVHVNGQDNAVADFFSRPDQAMSIDSGGESIISHIALGEMISDQRSDVVLQKILNRTGHSLVAGDDGIVRDTHTGAIWLPARFRHLEFDRLHKFSHPGFRASLSLVSARYLWPGIRKDVKRWCLECSACQSSKVTRHTRSPLGAFPPCGRFERVHIDLVGPLPSCNETRYLFTMIDNFTGWLEVVPLKRITAQDIATVFFGHWITRFGCPRELISDQGRNFASSTLKQVCQILGIEKHQTSAYHPQSNGKLERQHRRIKDALRCASSNASSRWFDDLPTVLLGLRNAINSDGVSAAEMVFGFPLVLPGDFFTEDRCDSLVPHDNFAAELRQKLQQYRPSSQKGCQHKKVFVSPALKDCQHVWLRQEVKAGLERPYRGPFKVLKRNRDFKTFIIDRDGDAITVSVDRLKPVFSSREGG
jgi:transposase InsO family protein